MTRKILLFLLLGLAVVGGLGFWKTHYPAGPRWEKQTRFMMDTYVTIEAAGPGKTASRAIGLALDRMEELDEKMNPFNPKSPLYAFNHHGAPITDPEILGVVRTALEVSQASEGAFDITTFPLTELWGFGTESVRVPSEEKIKETLKNVGYHHLILRSGRLEKDKKGVAIDLGAIAKGYAVAEAVKTLKAAGVTSGLVDAGGDVYALGRKDGRLWKVGIQAPRGEGLLGYLEVEDRSVACSGDYERFFMENGKRYHHIFNPRTGYPAEGLTSVTVVYPDCALTDAWTTALFVMGPEKGLEAVKKIPGLETIMITTTGEKLFSPGLKDALKNVPDNT